MKNLLRAFPLIMIISCQTQVSDNPSNSEPDYSYEIKDTTPALFAVPLDTAMKDMAHYDSVAIKTIGVDPIRAFTIRSVDLVEAMGLPVKFLKEAEYKHVRIYIGMSRPTNEFKIFLTPVEGANLNKGIAGKDVILEGPYFEDLEARIKGVSMGEGPYMLDFSAPCPNTCP